jgi:DNA-binding MarR family transcriptional regulator
MNDGRKLISRSSYMADTDTPMDVARALHHSATLMSRRLMAARAPDGLSAARLAVLGLLRREGPSTATALAAYLHIQPQSLTRLLADLDRRGLITRRAAETDRRQSLIDITEAGAATLLADVHDRRVMLAEAMAATLTPAERGLLRLAAGLMDRLAEAIETRTGAASAEE